MKLNNFWVLAASLVFAIANANGAETATVLFNGKDLTGWKTVGSKGSNQWQVGQAALDGDGTKLKVTGPGNELISPRSGLNLASQEKFGDCVLEMEFMLAKRSNSGVKMMNIYEIQMLDNYGKAVLGTGDCGAVYKEKAPKVNACKAAGEWQSLVIDWRAPRFDESGKKTANAKFVKVALNGQVIQENVELEHGTNVGKNVKEYPTGPVYLQGDHGPVAFRNMKITPVK